MSTQKLAELVTRLIRLTDQDRIEWTLGPDERSVMAAFPSYGVSLREHGSDFVIDIYNQQGNIIESIRDPEVAPWIPNSFQLMRSMYASARRRALGIDQAIDTLLDELPGDRF
jgi:hypothetical protein